MLTLDDLVDIDFEVQEALWRNWEESQQKYPELIELGLLRQPDPRLTREQLRARIETRFTSTQYFTMRKVVTGSRRQWKRGK